MCQNNDDLLKSISKTKTFQNRLNASPFGFIVVISIFTLALLQVAMVIYLFMDKEPAGHNQIVMNDKVMTTEVCTKWFESEMQYAAINKETPFNYQENLIPMEIVSEVCDKWLEVKNEVDHK